MDNWLSITKDENSLKCMGNEKKRCLQLLIKESWRYFEKDGKKQFKM